MFVKATRIGIVVLSMSACVPEIQSGHSSYFEFCAACHGPGGKGDGPAAPGLEKPPADLTKLARRNGGVFPRVRVMSVIDGYTRRDQHGSTMPEFGVLLGGPVIMLDTEDGVLTPTPERLVTLAAYVESLQE